MRRSPAADAFRMVGYGRVVVTSRRADSLLKV